MSCRHGLAAAGLHRLYGPPDGPQLPVRLGSESPRVLVRLGLPLHQGGSAPPPVPHLIPPPRTEMTAGTAHAAAAFPYALRDGKTEMNVQFFVLEKLKILYGSRHSHQKHGVKKYRCAVPLFREYHL